MPLTARVTCYRKDTSTDPDGDGRSMISFAANAVDQDWATPDGAHLMISMTVNADAAAQFQVDGTYLITIAEAT